MPDANPKVLLCSCLLLFGGCQGVKSQHRPAAPRSDTTTSLSGQDLSRAAGNGQLKRVRRAIENAGVDPDYVNAAGKTPLMMAASDGHRAVVRYLLEHGADVHARAEKQWFKGWTPLMIASAEGWKGVVLELLDNGADPMRKWKEEKRAVDLAKKGGHSEIVEILEDRQ